jgi:hypothetical protein
MAEQKKNPTETRLDKDVNTPSTAAPGDAPHDTTDPLEVAHTVTPQPNAEALAAGTVNGVLPGKPLEAPAGVAEKDQRTEEYEARRADGSTVKVKHNIDTGETSLA